MHEAKGGSRGVFVFYSVRPSGVAVWCVGVRVCWCVEVCAEGRSQCICFGECEQARFTVCGVFVLQCEEKRVTLWCVRACGQLGLQCDVSVC